MKEILRLAFIDFWPEWSDEDFITPILEEHFDIVIDNKNPDIIFHSVFGGNAANYNCKKIQFIGENKRPVNTDYSISFDPPSDTNFRLPLWQAYILKKPEILDRLFNKVQHESFERFCSFTVSNPANFMRNSVYQQLNNYKMVHSYGRYMTNDMGLQQASQGRYWRDAKDEFFLKHTHKFMLTYENNPKSYYCTEKLMDAFLAGSVPIYWGDPKVVEDWNLDAFINATKIPNVVEAVKYVDTNQAEFEKIYNAPIFKPEQKEKLLTNLDNFKTWLVEIVKK